MTKQLVNFFCDQKAVETYKANNDIINKALEDIKKISKPLFLVVGMEILYIEI